MSSPTIISPDHGTEAVPAQIGARLVVLDAESVYADPATDPYAVLIELVDEDNITNVIRLTRDAGEALLKQLDEALKTDHLLPGEDHVARVKYSW